MNNEIIAINSAKFQICTKIPYFCTPNADMAKLADALDLGSSAARHVGSTPIIRTH